MNWIIRHSILIGLTLFTLVWLVLAAFEWNAVTLAIAVGLLLASLLLLLIRFFRDVPEVKPQHGQRDIASHDQCPRCGCLLIGNTSGVCPECGKRL